MNTEYLKPATGGCNCGGVRYKVTDASKLRQVIACHCEQCRRFSGHYVAASGTQHKYFQFTHDASLKWHHYLQGMRRGFCSECGSSLFFDYPEKGRISIAAGTLDEDYGVKEVTHIYAAEAGNYYQLPQGVEIYQQEGCSLASPE